MHLMFVILLITAVGVLMLIVGAAVPQLQPNLAFEENSENLRDEDVCLATITAIELGLLNQVSCIL